MVYKDDIRDDAGQAGPSRSSTGIKGKLKSNYKLIVGFVVFVGLFAYFFG